jgi:orotidine-5'-phosphate decarboxylase
MNAAQLSETGVADSPEQQVLRLANLAKESGLAGAARAWLDGQR